MRKFVIVAAALAVLQGSAALAAEHEVLMLNKGESGAMVFEPAFVKAEPGDTIRFVPTDKGHNAESIKGMLPEGVESFKSAFSKEFVLEVSSEGVIGVKCTPHYGMGMVALIVVGDPVNLDAAMAVKHGKKASQRFAAAFEQLDAAEPATIN
jgi:pseudoazurin